MQYRYHPAQKRGKYFLGCCLVAVFNRIPVCFIDGDLAWDLLDYRRGVDFRLSFPIYSLFRPIIIDNRPLG
ncbi:MAG: hypothetical protein JW786_02805 [Desulfobacterales bacterium]|nr:hypothetical protein [Desulfobacterales bacterium]